MDESARARIDELGKIIRRVRISGERVTLNDPDTQQGETETYSYSTFLHSSKERETARIQLEQMRDSSQDDEERNYISAKLIRGSWDSFADKAAKPAKVIGLTAASLSFLALYGGCLAGGCYLFTRMIDSQ